MKRLALVLTGLALMASPAFAEQHASAAPQDRENQAEYRIERKYQKKIADINKEYDEDVADIQKSGMSDDLKALRIKHAAEKRDLDLKHAAEKKELRQKQRAELKALSPDALKSALKKHDDKPRKDRKKRKPKFHGDD